MEQYRGTTSLSVRRHGKVVIGGDGQVSMGNTVMKSNARKVRRLHNGKVIAGFAGGTADAFTLFELFEAQLEKHQGQLVRAAVELAKAWRTDRALRRLEALLAVADRSNSLIITGNGDVIEPEDSLIAIGSSEGFVATARATLSDRRAAFQVGDAQAISLRSASRDVAVSALMLNFVPDKLKALREMKRVVRTGETIGFYVWDYPGHGVEFLRAFWDAAAALDPAARERAEDKRFAFCTPNGLRDLMSGAGLVHVDCTPIEIPTVFADFADYWRPFTLGTGPAPSYCASLDPPAQQRLKNALDERLPRREDGSIPLEARAWAVKAVA